MSSPGLGGRPAAGSSPGLQVGAAGEPRAWARFSALPALVLAALATLAHAVIYGAANQFPLDEPRLLQLTALDLWVPFLPGTVWLYLSDYLLVFVSFNAIKRPVDRAAFVVVFLVMVVSASLVHWGFPVAYPRALAAVGAAGDPVTAALLRTLHALDSPSSCFPSLHVATATLSALSAWRHLGKWRLLAALWAAAIAVSTLTIKQHYAVDVVAGAALAVSLHWLLGPPVERWLRASRRQPSPSWNGEGPRSRRNPWP